MVTSESHQYHYTYRITNLKINRHYYGTRTSNINPKEDLGIEYFSSSTNKEFIQDMKDNPSDYRYKILRISKTRKEALELEIKLHNKFNVGINENFYNKVKQTSTGFDRSGVISPHSEEHKRNLGNSSKGMVLVTDGSKFFKIPKEEYLEGSYKFIRQDQKHSRYSKDKISKNRIDSEVAKGSNNPNAKLINIYDVYNNVIYQFNGNFKTRCLEIGLPYPSFYKSLISNSKLYQNLRESDKTVLIRNDTYKYKGWYARHL